MTQFILETCAKPAKLSNPILIAGLPGIGNVGKVAMDFIVDNLKCERTFEIFSDTFPHSVFINEDNTAELPGVRMHFHNGKKDFIFLEGDTQPLTEKDCYKFCDYILDITQKLGCKQIITLGGVGRESIPKKPKIYGTANSEETLNKYKDLAKDVNFKISGEVGNIFGASGVLLGLAKLRDIPGTAFLVDTYAHPMHLGLEEARVLVQSLNKTFDLKLDLKKLDREIKESISQIERFAKQEEEIYKVIKSDQKSDMNYIG